MRSCWRRWSAGKSWAVDRRLRIRPVSAVTRRTALAVAAALCVAGAWWLVRAPAVDRAAAAEPPPPDIETPAGRARMDSAWALATMPDDPWTFAESLAASAPESSDAREKEDCGMAEAPQFAKTGSADHEPVPTRAASSNWRAAQARVDASLRASADPMDRAVADLLNVGDMRTPDAVAEAVAQQAADSSDARVVALGYGVCRRDGGRAPSCAALTAERWARVDLGNGVPWIDLLAEAQARGDDAAVQDALAHLAAASRFDLRIFAPAGAVARHMPADVRELAAAGDLAARSVGQAATLPLPAFMALYDVCRHEAGGDEARARQCREISDAMYAHSDTLITYAISGALLFQTTGDSSRRDAVQAERAILLAHWSPGTGFEPCKDLRDTVRRLERNDRIGEVEAMREEARRFVPP